ncbi:MAG: ABC transporter ATP-binding protein [Candidatus Woesearchaeota archaeon]|nr:MAG: ABC transporter ATP-binding protein [Candidatus Woesearchaeota archaeon]
MEVPVLSPLKRLFRLIKAEKKDVYYLYGYAIIAGFINLSLPLGIQAIIGLVTAGQSSTSLVVLISFVLIGILIAGVLQLMQFSLVEYLQQRIFTNAALEFAYRIPRVKMEAVLRIHTPELMNRFFDTLTIQKGLSKILMEISTASLQILFGLLLLSFYHPFFIFLGMFFILVLAFIIRITAPVGLQTSLKESKHKYRVVHILEEIARTLQTLKLIGKTDLPEKNVDREVSQYLNARTKHFKILLIQMGSFIGFKFLVTGALLILGSVLLIDRQINIGQFVAAEIIIIIILNAVEKLINSLDIIYDVLTALEKVGGVTDLPLEINKGININKENNLGPFEIKIDHLNYRFPDNNEQVLYNINYKFESGKKYCLSGFNGSGKNTFINVITGLYENYTGSIRYNGFSLRDLDMEELRLSIGDNLIYEDIFEGTIFENVAVNRPGISRKDVYDCLTLVGLNDFVAQQKEGINSLLIAGAKGLPGSIAQKLIMARCIARKPRLLIINEGSIKLIPTEKAQLIRELFKLEATIIFVSNEKEIMQLCDETILLKNGEIIISGKYDNIQSNEFLKQIIEYKNA